MEMEHSGGDMREKTKYEVKGLRGCLAEKKENNGGRLIRNNDLMQNRDAEAVIEQKIKKKGNNKKKNRNKNKNMYDKKEEKEKKRKRKRNKDKSKKQGKRNARLPSTHKFAKFRG